MQRLMSSLKLTLALWAVGALLVGCDSLDDVSAEVRTQIQIGAAAPNIPELSELPPLDDLIAIDLSKHTSASEQVEEIYLESLTMQALRPTGQDMEFLGRMTLFIHADGMPSIEFARRDSFPVGVSKVSFDTTTANLKPYMTGSRVSVSATIVGAKRPSETTRLEMVTTFQIDTTIL